MNLHNFRKFRASTRLQNSTVHTIQATEKYYIFKIAVLWIRYMLRISAILVLKNNQIRRFLFLPFFKKPYLSTIPNMNTVVFFRCLIYRLESGIT
jgi:hypothetical protein